MTAQTAVQPISWKEAGPAEEYRCKAHQRSKVVDHLMKTAMGDPQVHRRLRASPEFQAALKALDPDLPNFINDDGLRAVIQAGCLYMIDSTAGLLKFAREHNMKLVP